MSNPLPENELPVNLRASQALTVRREQAQAPGTAAAAQLAPPVAASEETSGVAEEELLTVPALAAGAATVLLGTGWLLRRRHRLARRSHRRAEIASPQSVPGTPAPPADAAATPEAAAVPEAVALPEAAALPDADVMAELASQFEDEPESLHPQQTFPAVLERQHRTPSRIGLVSQKRLIRGLMWLRTVAGGAAILAAIAIVVFWAIETSDLRAGDSGLTRPLLALLLAGWGTSWGAGQLANLLHRVFFGRVHPKFDD